jgi:hypothetical protein
MDIRPEAEEVTVTFADGEVWLFEPDN